MTVLAPTVTTSLDRAEAWARLPMIGNCKLSPDGCWIAWA